MPGHQFVYPGVDGAIDAVPGSVGQTHADQDETEWREETQDRQGDQREVPLHGPRQEAQGSLPTLTVQGLEAG